MTKSYEDRVFINPADRMISELNGTFYKLSEVARAVGISESTLRRLKVKQILRAPSGQITRGGMRVYLYTPEDVEEIKGYYEKTLEIKNGKSARHHQGSPRLRGRQGSGRRPYGNDDLS